MMIQRALLSEVSIEDKKLLLIDRYIEFNKLRESWNKRPGLKNVTFDHPNNFTRTQDSVLNDIIRNINKAYLIGQHTRQKT